jgi:hypothetical protein
MMMMCCFLALVSNIHVNIFLYFLFTLTERSSVYAAKISRLLDDLTSGAGTSYHTSPLWKSLQLQHWSCIEVHDWIKSAANEYNIDTRDRKLLVDIFSRHSGTDLVSMTLEDFKGISVKYGEILFMTIHSHVQEGNYFISAIIMICNSHNKSN